MRRLQILVAAFFLAGCSSTPKATLVSNDPFLDRVEMKGLPFRAKAVQTVRLFRWDTQKQAYVEVLTQSQVLADLSRLYSLDVESFPFASPALRISQAPDNSLKEIQVTGTDNTSGALDAVNTGIAGVAKGQSDLAAAQLTRITDATTAVKACKDALAAQQMLASTASDQEKASAQALIVLAKTQIEQTYAVAGLPLPSPNPCDTPP